MTTRVFAAATIVLVTLSFPVTSHAQSVLSQGLWINRSELMALPTSGTAWTNLLSAAQVSDRLTDLTPAQLRKVRDHEKRNANRKSVLQAVERKLK